MIGKKLGPYQIEAQLGAGAMGVVYLGVRQTDQGLRHAAVKIIPAELMNKGAAFKRFEREIIILRQLRHPNIVRYEDEGNVGDTFFYAMEYVKGSTLDRILQKRGALAWQDVVKLGIQICEALHYAHEHGVVHRDLKPSNLMVTKQGQLKLTDFGIAKALDRTEITATGRTLGTAAYMAPEQIRGTEISHKTDIYALGVLLYQLLVGKMPFEGSTVHVLMHCHVNEPAPLASSKSEQNLPVELDQLVHKMMEKRPEDRPWDCAAISMTLRAILEKIKTKKSIPMVYPEEGTPEANPTRAGTATNVPTAEKKKLKKKKQRSLVFDWRQALPTVGLVAGLLVVGGLIAYIMWPPSAAYLVSKAEPLMASTERADWLTAKNMYLDELDRRYPNHEFKSKTDAWIDKIELTSAERRGDVLEKSGIASLKKAGDSQGEQMFAAVFPEADAAIKRFDDIDAARRWKEMAASLEKETARSERGWMLLAKKRQTAVEDGIAKRSKEVEEQIERVNTAEREGHAAQAKVLRNDVIERFGKYSDQAERIAKFKATPPLEASAPQ